MWFPLLTVITPCTEEQLAFHTDTSGPFNGGTCPTRFFFILFHYYYFYNIVACIGSVCVRYV